MSDWQNLFDEARRENSLANLERAEALVSLAIEEAGKLPPDSTSYSSAQCSFALWRYCQDRFAEAEGFQIRYIDAERCIGIGDRELANLMMWLAEMQLKQGKLNIAQETIEKAIAVFPPDYLPELSGAYEVLASVFEGLGDSISASVAKTKSVELRRKWDGLVEGRRRSRASPNTTPPGASPAAEW
jgi:tetratricopeptide (TPR) repeat protein